MPITDCGFAFLHISHKYLRATTHVINTNIDSNTNYISNANAIGFYKPSQHNVTLTFFWTDFDGVFYDRPNTSTGEFPFIISITGIDAYKIHHPSKGLRYSYINNLSSVLNLRFYDGVSIDPIDSTATKGRIRQFNNINLRQIIGSETYDKYKKFALITRRIFYISSGAYAAGSFVWTFFLSGNRLRFERPAYTTQSLTSISTAVNFHYSNPVPIGFSGIPNNDYYLEYVFDKPTCDTTDLIIHYSSAVGLSLGAANTANNDLFPNFVVQFEIIPVKEMF